MSFELKKQNEMHLLQLKKIATLISLIFIISLITAFFAVIVCFKIDFRAFSLFTTKAIFAGCVTISAISIITLLLFRKNLLATFELLQEQIGRGRNQMQVAEKMATLGRLAAGVAHEIRNPLTSIKMRLFSLGREFEDDSPQKEDLQVISEEVDHLETIVQNFLQFARPPEVKLETVPINDIIKGVCDLLSHKFSLQDIEVKMMDSTDPMMVLADKDQLKQVFMNIFLNSCDAMPDGGFIRIGFERTNLSGKKAVKVKISNSGPPIPDEERNNIFEPFYSTRDDGTGLGLSIAKRIVIRHHGEIKLEPPSHDEGVCFSVTIPSGEEGRNIKVKNGNNPHS